MQVLIGAYLDDCGYAVLPAYGMAEALAILEEQAVDVVLLDPALPDMEDMAILPLIAERTQAPVIVINGKDTATERILGFEMGADDYLGCVFEMRELLARIKAARRRVRKAAAQAAGESGGAAASRGTAPNDVIAFGKWRLDRRQYQLFTANGESAGLTTGEFRLLETLALSPRRVLTRDYLFDATRDAANDSFDRAVDIQIGRIRKKVKELGGNADIVKTVRGVGYMFLGGAGEQAS